MSAPRRTTLTVVGVAKIGSRWVVTGEPLSKKSKRTFRFSTTSPRFAKHQRVTVTHHTVRQDGTLVGARFSALENITIDRKLVEGSQVRTRTRSFIQLLAAILSEFQRDLGYRSGSIQVEGFTIEVVPEKNSWFRTPDGLHHVFGRDVASWILRQGVEI